MIIVQTCPVACLNFAPAAVAARFQCRRDRIREGQPAVQVSDYSPWWKCPGFLNAGDLSNDRGRVQNMRGCRAIFRCASCCGTQNLHDYIVSPSTPKM